MIILKLIISPKERQKFSFLTSFSFLTCFRVEIDISYHFHKIRSKCEIISPTFTRKKGPISCLIMSWEKAISDSSELKTPPPPPPPPPPRVWNSFSSRVRHRIFLTMAWQGLFYVFESERGLDISSRTQRSWKWK